MITLIEDDKRLGAENELIVTLPYSNEKFGVPPNLYIIGTMNTADRSIALMDTALRRRFTFIEMMPKPELLNTKDEDGKYLEDKDKNKYQDGDLIINDINVRLMLQKINERIEFLYDRDHTIGHSYFIKLKDLKEEKEQYAELCQIFSNRIIPLLQEYFYDDWEKIQIVLGDHYKQSGEKKDKDVKDFDDKDNTNRFIQSKDAEEKKIIGFDHEDYENKITFRINPDLELCKIDKQAFIKIYQTTKSENKENQTQNNNE